MSEIDDSEMEYIDVVDEYNKVIGITDVGTAHRMRLLHRVVAVFVFSSVGHLYLQRSKGIYDNSVGGHVKAGESDDVAAERELKEELNLGIPIKKITTFIPQIAKLGHVWTIYEGTAPKEWKFEETEEVKVLEMKKMSEWQEYIKKSPDMFTYGLRNTMGEYLKRNNVLWKY